MLRHLCPEAILFTLKAATAHSPMRKFDNKAKPIMITEYKCSNLNKYHNGLTMSKQYVPIQN